LLTCGCSQFIRREVDHVTSKVDMPFWSRTGVGHCVSVAFVRVQYSLVFLAKFQLSLRRE